MYDLNSNETPVIDALQIEAEARRMRAEVVAQGLSALARRIATLFAANPTPNAQN